VAGPSVVVRFLGDLTGLGKSLGDTEKKGTSTAKNIHSAFSSTLGALNKSGVLGPFGAALEGVDQVLGTISEHGKNIGPKMAGVGLAVTGVGMALSAVGSKEQASQQQLQAAIGATGKSYDDYAGKIDEAVKHQEHYGRTAGETKDALRILTQATHDPAKALELLGTTSDVAAAKHMDLSGAATQMGKVYNGNTRLLKAFGITAGETSKQALKGLESATKNVTKADDAAAKAKQNLADLQARLSGKTKLTVGDQQALKRAMDNVTTTSAAAQGAHEKLQGAQDAAAKSAGNTKDTMQKLADVTKGQAAAQADTFTGKIDAMKAKLTDAAAMIGQKYGPALQTAGVIMTAFGSIMSVVSPLIAAGEMSWLWPVLLVIGGLAALGVAVYVVYRNWDTIWKAMHAAIMFVWNWIKANWPLLLGILLGPIAIAVGLIITHFNTVKSVVKVAVDYIVGLWNGLVGFFRGIVSTIGGILSGIWGGVSSFAGTAVQDVKNAFNGMVSFVEGIPGRITSAAGHMFDGIKNAFDGVVNGIANAWNSTVGSLSVDIPGWVPGIGGKGFHAPTIPHLAQGGLITSTGLVFAHAGEAITPIPGRLGPIVEIQHAEFATTLDVDTFMQRVAWTARTAGV
jgi:hypothetical protein